MGSHLSTTEYPLAAHQTGGVDLPQWAYTKEVAEWVRQLAKRDHLRAASVKVFESGFTETSRRFLFVHEDNYKNAKNTQKRLITVLPSGKSDDRKLLQEEEAALTCYLWQQSMEESVARNQKDARDFVWQREDGTFAVVQLWRIWFNSQYKKDFQIFDNTPANKIRFDVEAFREFQKAVQNLFQLETLDPNLPFKYVQKESHNHKALYVGKGRELMSMLRLDQKLRQDLDIVSLVEPDGFESKWKDQEGREGTRVFRMDLTQEYCLYTRIGGDTMACTKPRMLFAAECRYNEQEAKRWSGVGINDVDVTTYVMDLDWFAEEAYLWAWRSAVVVWSCAGLMLLVRIGGSALELDFVNRRFPTLYVSTGLGGLFAMYADFSAMRWCVVAWLQNVKKMKIMGMSVPYFPLFFWWTLMFTFLQAFTIQSNVWFMVSAVQHNDQVLEYWEYLWRESMWNFLPACTWRNVITPAYLAIFLWLVSTVQLGLPFLTSLPFSSSIKGKPFPTKEPQMVNSGSASEDEQSARTPLLPGGASSNRSLRRLRRVGNNLAEKWPNNLCPCLGGNDYVTPSTRAFTIEDTEGDHTFTTFVPEEWHHDFSTFAGQHCSSIRRRCTYRESVAKLALASGLRVTGSMSYSYPEHMIEQIIKCKKGYKVDQGNGMGLDPLPLGWELRACKEFQKLAAIQFHRIRFIMFCKLALQMNLQITFIIIARIRQKYDEDYIYNQMVEGDVAGCISVLSLFLTFVAEVWDVWWFLLGFWKLRTAVEDKVSQVAAEEEYAFDDYVHDGTGKIERIVYSGKDLKNEFHAAWWKVFYMALYTIFCMWFVGYGLLKTYKSWSCESGLWEFLPGCLPPLHETQAATMESCAN